MIVGLSKDYIAWTAGLWLKAEGFASQPGEKLQVIHAMLGIAGEYMEFMNIPTLISEMEKPIATNPFYKEAGDCFYYCAALAHTEIGEQVTEWTVTWIWQDKTIHKRLADQYVMWLVEKAKKMLAYDDDYPDLLDLGRAITTILQVILSRMVSLELVLLDNEVDIPMMFRQIENRNQAKLNARYPQGYSHQAAIARVDVQSETPQQIQEIQNPKLSNNHEEGSV